MDEDIFIETDGRVVGVVVRVRGGFMFFASDPDLKVLEATVFRRAEMVARRVAEMTLQAKRKSKEQTAIGAPQNWSASAIEVSGGNVVRLYPKARHTSAKPEPPDAA